MFIFVMGELVKIVKFYIKFEFVETQIGEYLGEEDIVKCEG
jgi:hypothetical protein